VAALVLAASSALLSGCPGDLDPRLMGSGSGGSGGGPNVCDGAAMMADTLKCGSNAGCHGATAQISGMDLVTAGVAGRLLGRMPDPATSTSCGSSAMPYIVSGSNPATGLLFDKLNSLPTCGSPMPFPLGNLPQADRDCLQEWANAVASGQIQ
jgi:hypothetical protein